MVERSPGVVAEVGLEAPDAEHDVGIHAEAAFRLLQRILVGATALAAGLDARRRDGAGEILRGGLLELGLMVGLLQHALVGRDAGEGAIEGLARDAAAVRLRPQAFDEGMEAGLETAALAVFLRMGVAGHDHQGDGHDKAERQGTADLALVDRGASAAIVMGGEAGGGDGIEAHARLRAAARPRGMTQG